MYRQQAAAGAAAGDSAEKATEQEKEKEGEVIDAEFVDVDDEKK